MADWGETVSCRHCMYCTISVATGRVMKCNLRDFLRKDNQSICDSFVSETWAPQMMEPVAGWEYSPYATAAMKDYLDWYRKWKDKR